LLSEAPRPVLVPTPRGLQLAELLHALRARRRAVLARAPESPAEARPLLAACAQGLFDMRAFLLEETLDLPAADADAPDVTQDVRRPLVGQVGGQVERLLPHRRRILGADDADPFIEGSPHGPAGHAAVPSTLQI